MQLSAEAALARAAVSGEQSEGHFEDSTSIDATRHGRHKRRTCVAQQARAAAGMASRRRARAPPDGRAQRRSRVPKRRWLEPRSAASRARVISRRARSSTGAARAPWATLRASLSKRKPPPAWRAGEERECRRADERSDAAECRGGACSSCGQRRAERGSFRGEHEHRRNAARAPRATHVHRAVSASRRRHGDPAASESAAELTSAATQPITEAAQARAAVSGE